MSRTCCSKVDRGNDERLFSELFEALRDDAIMATRDYRRREVHRGRNACRDHLCGDCQQDVYLAVWEVFQRSQRHRAEGRATRLTETVDQVLARVRDEEVEVNRAYLRSLLANAGKDARRKMRTGLGRSAKPDAVLRQRSDFQRLRDMPLLFEVALLMIRLAESNTPLPASVLPYRRLTEELEPRLAELGLPVVRQHEMPGLVARAMSAAEAIDPAWVSANVTGPLSERLTELRLPESLEASSADWQATWQLCVPAA